MAALARRLLRAGLRLAAEGFALLTHPLRRPVLADGALSTSERAFLIALREHVRANPVRDVHGVVLCEGERPLRRPAGRPAVLRLPRGNPIVRACLRAFTADARWTRMIYLALVSPSSRSK